MAYHSEFLFFEYTIFSEITLLGTMKKIKSHSRMFLSGTQFS